MTTDPIRAWAARYEQELDADRSERSLAAQKARLLFALARGRRTSRTRAFFWVPALAAVFAAAGAWFIIGAPRAEEQISADNAQIPVGRVLESGTSVKRVAFSGGSVAELAANSRVRLVQNSPAQVEWRVLDGSMTFDVERREGREWWIWAGGTRVRVLGTAFAVGYASKDDALEVRVQRGRVEVQHPGAAAFVLGAGAVYVAPRAVEPVPALQPEEPPLPGVDETGGPGTELEQAAPSSGKLTARPSAPGWQDLVRSGKYEAALGAVRSAGLDAVLTRADAHDLLLLGNAARFQSDYGLSERIYLRVRSVGEPSSRALAAYYLARIALDGHRNSAEAIRWLRTYLGEAPRGELSAAARGRLMDLLDRAGDARGARAVAAEYLELHGGGPDAGLARRLVRAESE